MNTSEVGMATANMEMVQKYHFNSKELQTISGNLVRHVRRLQFKG
jgi:hypothetical protein